MSRKHDDWIPIGPSRKIPSAGFEISTSVRRSDLEICLELFGADPELSDATVKGIARERGVDVVAASFEDALSEARRRVEGRPEGVQLTLPAPCIADHRRAIRGRWTMTWGNDK